MASRDDFGSWLEGGPDAARTSARGARLGLPPAGPGSPARAGRRVAALAVDWLACLLISAALFPDPQAPDLFLLRGDSLATVGVLAVENLLLVSTLGTTLGHRLLGLRVHRLGPPSDPLLPVVGIVPALVRTVLLCLVVPAAIWDGDGRGVHDRAAGTVIVRT